MCYKEKALERHKMHVSPLRESDLTPIPHRWVVWKMEHGPVIRQVMGGYDRDQLIEAAYNTYLGHEHTLCRSLALGGNRHFIGMEEDCPICKLERQTAALQEAGWSFDGFGDDLKVLNYWGDVMVSGRTWHWDRVIDRAYKRLQHERWNPDAIRPGKLVRVSWDTTARDGRPVLRDSIGRVISRYPNEVSLWLDNAIVELDIEDVEVVA